MQQYGVGGQYQAGIDIYLRLRPGIYECWQCKSGPSFGASRLREAVRAFETGEWMERTHVFRFVLSEPIGQTSLAEALESESVRLAEKGVTLRAIVGQDLCNMLADQPEVVVVPKNSVRALQHPMRRAFAHRSVDRLGRSGTARMATTVQLKAARAWCLRRKPHGGTQLRHGVQQAMEVGPDGRVDLEELEADTLIVLCDGLNPGTFDRRRLAHRRIGPIVHDRAGGERAPHRPASSKQRVGFEMSNDGWLIGIFVLILAVTALLFARFSGWDPFEAPLDLFDAVEAAEEPATVPDIVGQLNKAAEGHKALAALAVMTDDYETAVLEYSKALSFAPGSVELYTSRSTAKLILKDFLGAEADAGQALKLDPRSATAFVARGTARVQQNRFQGGLDDFSAALEIDPANAKALLFRGLVRNLLGEHATAIADLEQAADEGSPIGRMLAEELSGGNEMSLGLTLTPDERSAGAHALFEQANYFEAFAEFSTVIEQEPKRIDALMGRARVNQKLGFHFKAAEDLTLVIEIDPSRAEAYLLRGQVKVNIRHAPGGVASVYELLEGKALADFSEAIRLDPQSADAYLGRAQLHLLEKDLDAAQRDLDMASSLAPK